MEKLEAYRKNWVEYNTVHEATPIENWMITEDELIKIVFMLSFSIQGMHPLSPRN
jgi:hypothetical protein